MTRENVYVEILTTDYLEVHEDYDWVIWRPVRQNFFFVSGPKKLIEKLKTDRRVRVVEEY